MMLLTSRLASVALFVLLSPLAIAQSVITAYVFPQQGPLQPNSVDARALTRINYAFALIKDGRMVEGSPDDAHNLGVLTGLRSENPHLQILASVGGWLGSGAFSDVALTRQSRAAFVQSAMEFLRKYDLDGLDVDWEYPGLVGAGNHFRPEDAQNFTLLLQDLRAGLTAESRARHKRLHLTIAAGAFNDFLAHTEMGKAQASLDSVNLMSYDYYEAGSDKITGHHAPLFSNPKDPKNESTDTAVRAFEKAGVPAAKIVLGVPFYGRMWGQVADVEHGLYQPGMTIPNSYAPYSVIASSMLGQDYVRFWDPIAKVPWLYNAQKQVFVSYEDPESLGVKCSYVRERGLGGVMFWSYFNDNNEELLKAIDKGLGSGVPAAK